jgi:hypothetical protein
MKYIIATATVLISIGAFFIGPAQSYACSYAYCTYSGGVGETLPYHSVFPNYYYPPVYQAPVYHPPVYYPQPTYYIPYFYGNYYPTYYYGYYR